MPGKPRGSLVKSKLLLCSIVAAAAITACSSSQVTHTVGGIEVTAVDSPVGAAAQVNPCTAVSTSTLERLGLAGLEPATLSPKRPGGCRWEGINNYTTPSLILWVTGPAEPDPKDEIVDISGIPVRVYTVLGNVGRYIAYLDEVTLAVNYDGANHLIGAREALEAAMIDVLDAYQRP